jgi:hypothetical protein
MQKLEKKEDDREGWPLLTSKILSLTFASSHLPPVPSIVEALSKMLTIRVLPYHRIAGKFHDTPPEQTKPT